MTLKDLLDVIEDDMFIRITVEHEYLCDVLSNNQELVEKYLKYDVDSISLDYYIGSNDEQYLRLNIDICDYAAPII